MTNYLCRFPDGAAGLGLLVLRTCYAALPFGIVASLPSMVAGTTVLRLIAGALAVLLVGGFATRAAAIVLGIAILAALPFSASLQVPLLAANLGGCAAMALLGAGAYSLDARHHGHRVIHVQTRPPDRGGAD